MASNDQQSDNFMDLTSLNQQLESIENEPPFEQWQPTVCGDIDIVIAKDGTWFHEGKAITRVGLVKLLARVLIKEGEDYFLKTPVEKMRIQVEDAPFVITRWQHIDSYIDNQSPSLKVFSNLDHQAILCESHPLVSDHQTPNSPALYVILHRQLKARVHRNVYYQWAEIAQEQQLDNETHFVITSGNHVFSIGRLD